MHLIANPRPCYSFPPCHPKAKPSIPTLAPTLPHCWPASGQDAQSHHWDCSLLSHPGGIAGRKPGYKQG